MNAVGDTHGRQTCRRPGKSSAANESFAGAQRKRAFRRRSSHDSGLMLGSSAETVTGDGGSVWDAETGTDDATDLLAWESLREERSFSRDAVAKLMAQCTQVVKDRLAAEAKKLAAAIQERDQALEDAQKFKTNFETTLQTLWNCENALAMERDAGRVARSTIDELSRAVGEAQITANELRNKLANQHGRSNELESRSQDLKAALALERSKNQELSRQLEQAGAEADHHTAWQNAAVQDAVQRAINETRQEEQNLAERALRSFETKANVVQQNSRVLESRIAELENQLKARTLRQGILESELAKEKLQSPYAMPASSTSLQPTDPKVLHLERGLWDSQVRITQLEQQLQDWWDYYAQWMSRDPVLHQQTAQQSTVSSTDTMQPPPRYYQPSFAGSYAPVVTEVGALSSTWGYPLSNT